MQEYAIVLQFSKPKYSIYLGTGNCKSKYPTTIVSILENRLEIHIGSEDGNITTMFKNSSIDFSIDFEFPVVSMTSNSDDQIIYWIDTRGMVHLMRFKRLPILLREVRLESAVS